MTSLHGVEIFCTILLGIIIISILRTNNRRKSAISFIGVCASVALGCILEVACALLQGKGVNDVVFTILLTLVYCMGAVSLGIFILFCCHYIREKAKIGLAYFYIPLSLVAVATILIIINCLNGSVFHVENGVATQTGGLPTIPTIIQLAIIAYLPIAALKKRKEIGMRAVFVLGIYGIFPFIAVGGTLLFGLPDYSFPASALVCFIAYIVLVNQSILDEQKLQQRLLTDRNHALEMNRDFQEERFNVINSMTSIYFSSYYIDLRNDSYVELKTKDSVRSLIGEAGVAQASLYMACEKLMAPEFEKIMKDFFNLSTINERLKDKNAVSCEYIGVTTGWSMAYLIAGDRDEEGNLIHVFFAARTIHDEKRREFEQENRLKEYADIVANAGLGIWYIILKDGEKPRMRPNEKMRELIGIQNPDMKEEDIYAHWYERIDPGAIESVNKSVGEMVSGKFSENTYIWNHPLLGDIYVRCGGRANVLEDGTCILSGYHCDVTEIVNADERQKKALAEARLQAEAASKAKSSFLFSMSHDIRTPMNAVIGFTDLLEAHLDDEQKARDYLGKIRQSSAFLLDLINNVLEVARIESGKVTVDENVQEAGFVAHEIETVFSEKMKEKGIDFRVSVDVQTKYFYSDIIKSKQIFLNLVSNAYKYTPAGGTVTLSVKELPCDREGCMLLQTQISDSGIGMSKDYLPHIFEEFSREKTVTEDGIEGTGLGMPIVKRLVDLMGGTIEVESDLGKGTTFTILMYHRIGAKQDYAAAKTVTVDESLFRGKRILLAEDNDLNAEIAEEILKNLGFLVERAADGIICVDLYQKAERGYYDLILMDIQMPHMNGYKATEIIRSMENPIDKTIPIIAMTANAFEEDRQNALKAGMNDHLAKPIRMDELLTALAKALT